ncbi:MAG: GNAT family N-acetyltransferase [Oscillospiraceae bacterium]|jgi:ribosomal-protein-alanine N-acetyltransferase|nr:GNAT family N-acetyltransferase [Oscillospiraceae bacterium]
MEKRGIIAQTERLILRRYTEADLQDLWEYLSDEEVVAYEPYKPMSLEEVKDNLEWRIGTDEMVAVELRDSHKMIGNVYLGKREFVSLEIGYVFNRSYWGNGYAAESCKALIQQAFSNGIHRIYAECDPKNESSWKLLERLRFRREAHLIQNVSFWNDRDGNPVWKDTYIYARLEIDK